MKHEAWTARVRLLGFEITPEQAETLDDFERLLLERAVPQGMIAAGDRALLRERHLVDSIRAAPLLGPFDDDVADIGSGAGLPGIPLAIVLPDHDFHLVEVRSHRVAFLELAVETLRITNIVVVHEPIEDVTSTFSVCLARALADPLRAWRLSERVLAPTGRLLYWAGRAFDPSSGTPEGVAISVVPTPGLADAGPIVIMTRQ